MIGARTEFDKLNANNRLLWQRPEKLNRLFIGLGCYPIVDVLYPKQLTTAKERPVRPMNINQVIQTGNPYYGPIKHMAVQLSEVEWRFPFLAQALVFLTSCVVLVILALLYITVGLIAQISAIFSYLIQQARQDMQGKPTIEKTGFIVAIGVYFLL